MTYFVPRKMMSVMLVDTITGRRVGFRDDTSTELVIDEDGNNVYVTLAAPWSQLFRSNPINDNKYIEMGEKHELRDQLRQSPEDLGNWSCSS